MNKAPLWSGLALVPALEAFVLGTPPAGVTGVSIDTRTLKPDDLFIAIRGDNGDGHEYVRAALEKGASAAVVDAAHRASLRGAGPLYVVRDTLRALQSLGAAARARSPARIVAVTGSVGKTSTKEALRIALGSEGVAHASAASYNNHWGVPLSLARMPPEAAFGVFEIGMNHAGEISPLAKLARPHIAVVTTIAPVHLENFASLDAIAEAKAEIFDGLEPDGCAILNCDIPQFELLRERARIRAARICTFGESAQADARLAKVEPRDSGSEVEAVISGRRLTFWCGAPGRHFAVNSLAVLLAAQAAGVELDEAAQRLANFAPPKGRGRRLTLRAPDGPFTLIDESYNANPASMKAAIELLGEARVARPARRIAVLGDMLELGQESPRLHAELSGLLERNEVALVFAAGPQMDHMFNNLPGPMRGSWKPRSSELIEPLAASLNAGDIVMIKGSNGSQMEPVVAALEQRYARSSDDIIAQG